MAYPEKLQETVDLLQMVDRSERIQLLIDIADRFQEVPAEVARRPFGDEHKVPACESEAFLWAERLEGDRLKFYFAVENPQGISAKAMAVILDESLSGRPVSEIVEVADDVVYDIFGRELSMGKSMGLMGMVSMATLSARKVLRQP